MPITGELQKIEFEVHAGMTPLAYGDAIYRGVDGKVYPASAVNLDTSKVLGIVSSLEGIPPLGGGLVMTQGIIEGVLFDFFAGDIVYLSVNGISGHTFSGRPPVVPADIHDRTAILIECGRVADNGLDLIVDIRHTPPYTDPALNELYINYDGSRPFINDQSMGDQNLKDLANPVDPQDATPLFFVEQLIQDTAISLTIVDLLRGNDDTGMRADTQHPFYSIHAALAASLFGDHVLALAGNFVEPSGIVLPSGVSLRGLSVLATHIVASGVMSSLNLVTMGPSTRLEDVTLDLTSPIHPSGTAGIVGVEFPAGTARTAKLRTSVVNVDNSGASVDGSSNVWGVRVQADDFPDRSVDAIRATMVTVKSTGGGKKLALGLDTLACNFSVRDCNLVARRVGGGAGTYYGAEINKVGALLHFATGLADGDT